MGFKNWLKSTFSSKEGIDLEEFSKDKLANEKWIEHYYKIGFDKPSGVKKEEFASRVMTTRNNLLGQIAKKLISVKSLNKNITIKINEPTKKHYEFLIRFIDCKGTVFKGILLEDGTFIRERRAGKNKDYLFSPLQQLILFKNIEHNILADIEFELMTSLNMKPTNVMKSGGLIKQLSFVKKELYYTETDGIQYFRYPIKKRIELYNKNHRLEKLAFPTIDNFFFKDFIEEIMSKRNDSKQMKRCCREVENLMSKIKEKDEK